MTTKKYILKKTPVLKAPSDSGLVEIGDAEFIIAHLQRDGRFNGRANFLTIATATRIYEACINSKEKSFIVVESTDYNILKESFESPIDVRGEPCGYAIGPPWLCMPFIQNVFDATDKEPAVHAFEKPRTDKEPAVHAFEEPRTDKEPAVHAFEEPRTVREPRKA